MSDTVFTFCRICEARCGLAVTVDGGRVTHIAPDKQNPHTWQDFCIKGRTANEMVEHPQRITAPMRRRNDGSYEEVPWATAVTEIASGLRRILDRDGADAIACYTGNPWGFSGSNPTFIAGLLDGIGTQSRYNVGSIDHNSFMVVAEEMWGSPLFTLIPDVDDCKCFLFVGTNPAESAMNWIGTVPNGWRRVLAAQAGGAELIVVDPRRTPTAERADVHLAVRPGGDWALLLALVTVVLDEQWEDRAACAEVSGMDRLRDLVGAADLAELARHCDVTPEALRDVARRFAHAPTAMCVARTGVAQTLGGTLAEWLANVLNVITGRVDAPGGRRYEPGYVDAVKLFDTMVPPMTHTSRVRGNPMIVGNHALAELPDEITTPGAGRVRALIIDCGNPVVSGPDGATLDAALADLELLVAVDLVQRESHRHAHWLIPGTHWLEREDLLAVTGGLEDRPFAQLAQKCVEPPPGVREEWEFFLALGLAMRVPMFGRRGVNTLARASRTVARVTRRPGLALNPRWIYRGLLRMGKKISWKQLVANPHGIHYAPKEYGRFRDALRTPDRRIQVAPPAFVVQARERMAARPPTPDRDHPFAIITRRRVEAMNSWLNELAGIHARVASNAIEINTADAEDLGISSGDLVDVVSPVGRVRAPVTVSDAPRRGVVVCEHGWGSRIFDPAGRDDPYSYGVNRNLLVSGTELDPLSQVPALNGQPVRLERVVEHERATSHATP